MTKERAANMSTPLWDVLESRFTFTFWRHKSPMKARRLLRKMDNRWSLYPPQNRHRQSQQTMPIIGMRFTHPLLPFGPGHPAVLWGRAVTSGNADYGFRDAAGRLNQSRILDHAGKGWRIRTVRFQPQTWLVPIRFGSNEERQFVDLLPGAANWKQKVDSLSLNARKFLGVHPSRNMGPTPLPTR